MLGTPAPPGGLRVLVFARWWWRGREIVRGVRGSAVGVADVAGTIAAPTAMTRGSCTTTGGLAGEVGRLEIRAVSVQETVGGLVRHARAA